MGFRENLYFIAVIPPQDICDEITGFRKDLANRFKTVAALKVMPHITLKAPFKFPAGEHEQTLDWFRKLRVTVPVFRQELKDFGSFNNRNSPVIFVNPVRNLQLEELQEQVLEHFIEQYPDFHIMDLEFTFRPHITVAYRDLQPALFTEAWSEYKTKKYEAAFEVNNFQLLQHDGRKWNRLQLSELLPAGRKQGE